MKKISLFLFLLVAVLNISQAQQAEDLFKPGRIKWLGVDYSHVKLIGDFSQFMGVGETGISQIKNEYFPAWNNLFLEEPDKYSVKSMLRKDDILYDLSTVTELNAKTPLETIEASKTPNYSKEDIQKFIRNYNTSKEMNSIGVLFLAESLNKNATEAYFHFVAIRLSDNEILIHERIKGKPQGAGIRNYWAGALLKVIESVQKTYYLQWKSKYAKS